MTSGGLRCNFKQNIQPLTARKRGQSGGKGLSTSWGAEAKPLPAVNCTPFVRQYGILITSGVFYYAKRNAKQAIYARV